MFGHLSSGWRSRPYSKFGTQPGRVTDRKDMSVSLPFLGYLSGFLGLDKAPRQGNRPMELTSSFVDLLPQFSPVFTAPTYQTFVAIVAGWVLSQRHRFITEVIF